MKKQAEGFDKAAVPTGIFFRHIVDLSNVQTGDLIRYETKLWPSQAQKLRCHFLCGIFRGWINSGPGWMSIMYG